MQSLAEKLFGTTRFLVAAELVSVRGSMVESSAVKVRAFASELAASPSIDWVSITDNAGGHPQLAPLALGRPILYAGMEVVIHLTCKDLNRNGLESLAWMLSSEGFHNILAMTGDYPVAGNDGLPKPVFDIDSIGLISMLHKMNRGLASRKEAVEDRLLERTQFCIGAVTTNFKLREGEVIPQYLKLKKKVQCGAHFIINQIGFDSRKMSELRAYMVAHGMGETPLLGNVYHLNWRTVQMFHEGQIPGVVVTESLWISAGNKANPPIKGSRSSANLRPSRLPSIAGSDSAGLSRRVHSIAAIERILKLNGRLHPMTGSSSRGRSASPGPANSFITPGTRHRARQSEFRSSATTCSTKHVTNVYQISKWSHQAMFTPGRAVAKWGAKVCARSRDSYQGPSPLRVLEHLSKAALFRCKDCGDCSRRISRISARNRSAQRSSEWPLWRNPRRPLRSGGLRRLHLAARL